MKDQKPKKKQLNELGKYASLGFQMAAAILVLTWLGNKADVWFELTQPYLTMTGAVIGIIVALYWIFTAIPKP
ncbi:MAG: AtpZ/AtpI family protein [Bacteroidia bacterium]